MFNIDYFTKLLKVAYKEVGVENHFSYKEVEYIFKLYFATFEKTFGYKHKNLKLETIKNIIEKLPYLDDSNRNCNCIDIEFESYEILIRKHFQTQYKNCDYSMPHFMSGRIREYRFYETCY